jgi:DNA-binding response OmpR family regulator
MLFRVLLISGNGGNALQIRADISRAGAEVVQVTPQAFGERADDLRAPEIIVVDARDPGVELRELCKAIKGSRRLGDAMVLAVAPEQRLSGLDACRGLDDFVTAPYREAELRARLRRMAARATTIASENTLTFGDLTIDPENYDVTLRGMRVDLTLKEYELLKHLVTHAGRVYTRDQLLNSVWGYDYVGGTRTVDVHIRRLRAKLGDAGEESIDTVRGVGYAWRPPRNRDSTTKRTENAETNQG